MQGNEDKKRFSVLMFWLASRMMAPGGKPKEIDKPLQADYFNALQDIRIERLEWAAKHIFANQTWFPMPKELRESAMLAPSSVIPVNPDRPALPDATYYEDGAKRLRDILDGLSNHMIAPE